MILETVVGRAQGRPDRVRKQRFTHEVKVIEARKVNVHAALMKSG
jgi:hypothetical protein